VSLYVALVRGINVGGSNPVAMTALKACFEAQRFRDVSTYIQSGNVVFSAGRASPRTLAARIEKALSHTFEYDLRVVVRSRDEMEAIVASAPAGFGRRSAAFRYDVIFLRHPLTAVAALKEIPTRPGVDRVFAGVGVVYTSRLISKASQSRLTRIVGTPAYQNMTIRNWNTTTKLLAMMQGIAAGS
jgi:uncharacterized protein (DUF1697 family)